MMGAEIIEEAVNKLRGGGVIIFPTDTVWGIGASLDQEKGLQKLYELKGREKAKPTAVLVDGQGMAFRYGVFNKTSRNLVSRYWPGGLTIIVSAREDSVPRQVRGGSETVGLRVPDNEALRRLIRKLGAGLATSSANFSGKKPPVKFNEIDEKLIKRADLVFCEGDGKGRTVDAAERLPSTVVDVTGERVVVVRQGGVKIDCS